jgi:hypothetical protein
MVALQAGIMAFRTKCGMQHSKKGISKDHGSAKLGL